MSQPPKKLAEYAPPDLVPRMGEGFDPVAAGFTPEDYFVLTRIDGRATLKEMFLASGLSEPSFVAAVRKLRDAGALLLPGDASRVSPRASVPAMPSPAPASSSPHHKPVSLDDDDTGFGQDGSIGSIGFGTSSSASGIRKAAVRAAPSSRDSSPPRRPAAAAPSPIPAAADSSGRFSSEPSSVGFGGGPHAAAARAGRRYGSEPRLHVEGVDLSALTEVNDLSQDQRRAILVMEHIVKTGSLYDILDAPQEAPEKELRRAYFRISKDFHPDRYYGKVLGTYKERLALIFERVSRAWEVLGDEGQRAQYDGKAGRPESAHDQALRIYKDACDAEIGGELEKAGQMFDAAIRVDGTQPKILRRAAEALLRLSAVRAGVPAALASADPSKLADTIATSTSYADAKVTESLDRARLYAKKAAELQSRDAASYRTLSRVLRAGRDLEGARRALEQARRLEPENAHISDELDALVRRLLEPA